MNMESGIHIFMNLKLLYLCSQNPGVKVQCTRMYGNLCFVLALLLEDQDFITQHNTCVP